MTQVSGLVSDDEEAGRLVSDDEEAGRLVSDDEEAGRLVSDDDEAGRLVSDDEEANRLVRDDEEAGRLVSDDEEVDCLVSDDEEADCLVSDDEEADCLVSDDEEAGRLNNNINNHIQRRYSRFFTISSQRREMSPTRTLKWPGRNCVQITCNTWSAYHVQHVVLRATWYQGTAQLLSLTQLKSHLFELYFVG